MSFLQYYQAALGTNSIANKRMVKKYLRRAITLRKGYYNSEKKLQTTHEYCTSIYLPLQKYRPGVRTVAE